MGAVLLSSLPDYLQEAYRNLSNNRTSNISDVENLQVKSLNDIRSLPSLQERLLALLLRHQHLTEQLSKFGKCYPPTILERAETYEALEYDDLAAFDGYVVYMLCQKERSDEFVTDLEAHSLDGESWSPRPEDVRRLMIQSLALLVRCLTRLGAIDDARAKRDEFREQIAFATDASTISQDTINKDACLSWQSILKQQNHDPSDLVTKLETSHPSKFGLSRREIYLWSPHEPPRNTTPSLATLNTYLSTIAPHLIAKVTTLPSFDSYGNSTTSVSHQLGLFAKQDLSPGQEILGEKSILTAIRPLEDALCDACGQDLEGLSFDEVCGCEGEDCDVTFCSVDCRTRAGRGYHRANVGGMEDEDDEDEDVEDGEEIDEEVGEEVMDGVNSLTVDDKRDATQTSDPDSNFDPEQPQLDTQTPAPAPFCGNTDLSLIGRPKNTTTPEWDLYFLLLTRSIAMSITQNIHPLDLSETKYLWGDFNESPFAALLGADHDSVTPATVINSHLHNLPFSLLHSITQPLDFFTTLSLTHPGSTPYSALWLKNFDPWILQTLYSKFRGVANATQSTFDGMPEIAAVHMGWCLANHSCRPNVRWGEGGVRRFWVRGGEGEGMATGKEEREGKGIKAGEEIFSHYTDVRLPVKERRERLREVLGGNCRCERCIVESGDGV